MLLKYYFIIFIDWSLFFSYTLTYDYYTVLNKFLSVWIMQFLG